MPKDGGGHPGCCLFLYSLSISPYFFFFPPSYHFSRLALMSLPYHHYRFHFSTALLFFQPLVCSLCAPPSRTYSISFLGVSSVFLPVSITFPPQLRYLITLTKAGCRVRRLVRLSVCVFVFSLRDRCKDLAPAQPAARAGPNNRGSKDKCSRGKSKLKTFSWSITGDWSRNNLIAPLEKYVLILRGP